MQALDQAIYSALVGDAGLGSLLPGASHLVTISNATGGHFHLAYGGQTTAEVAWNAAASAVQTLLAALSSVNAGNVLVTGAAGGPYTATFRGTLQSSSAPLTADGSALEGVGASIAVMQQPSVHNTVALDPPAAYLVFSCVSSTPDWCIGSKVSEEYRYQFSIVAQGTSRAVIDAAIVRLEALFDRTSLNLSGKTFWYSEKAGDNPVLPEDVDGQLWLSGGADFIFVTGG